MGKTTLYHPISLTVIRGAAMFGHWRLGRMDQIAPFPTFGEARYEVEVLEGPLHDENGDTIPLDVLQNHLQNCFMDNIRVHWLHFTKSGRLMCHLQVSAPLLDHQDGSNRVRGDHEHA